jgi:hypothetical protein
MACEGEGEGEGLGAALVMQFEMYLRAIERESWETGLDSSIEGSMPSLVALR